VKNEAAFQKQLVKIGEKLAELRKKKGYTSHETFAYDYELSRVQYWRIEKGKSNLTLRSLYNLLEIHGIDLKDFFNSLPKG
jgi:transcriptional regulator with XRE-family HTH domain